MTSGGWRNQAWALAVTLGSGPLPTPNPMGGGPLRGWGSHLTSDRKHVFMVLAPTW